MAADAAPEPLQVMGGANAGLILTLVAEEVVQPEALADLAAVGGALAMPLLKAVPVSLVRVGEPKAGVQRFAFALAIPATERKASLVLRLRVRIDPAKAWLPMPAVRLESTPRTWKQTLQQFVRNAPSGRLGGGDRLSRLFREAELDVPEVPPDGARDDQGVRVWFAERGDEPGSLPESTGPSVCLVFKPGVRGGLELTRPDPRGAACVLVDDFALAAAEDNAAAQDLLERALALASRVTRIESTLSPHE